MFSCEFWEIFKNTFFAEHLQTTAFVAWLRSWFSVDWVGVDTILRSAWRSCCINLSKAEFKLSILFWFNLLKF